MLSIPHANWPDQTFSLWQSGNTFIIRQCEKLNSPIFQTRIFFKKTICFRGREAAQVFYDKNKFIRHSAAPKRLQRTLTGTGGVQGLDGAEHEHRKGMFMTLMSQENIARLEKIFEQYWRSEVAKWEARDSIKLYEEANRICFLAACEWSGIGVTQLDVQKRTKQMVAMIESPASIGVTYINGILARKQAEEWARSLICNAREDRGAEDKRLALHVFSHWKDPHGQLLDLHSAAVDLLNVLRPIVAIGRYIVFSALALHWFPSSKARLATGTEIDYRNFVQEVRRYFPFFPFIAAKVKQEFHWRGYIFPKGTRVLLDLYGTNRDPALWENPAAFDPQRFNEREEDAFDFIPQGGGSHFANHRCAGEWLTIALMIRAVKQLVNAMSYEVPQQKFTTDFNEAPALPKDGLVLTNVHGNLDLNGSFKEKENDGQHNFTQPLSKKEAEGALPENIAACGEEDPGAGLEDFVRSLKSENNTKQKAE